MLGMGNNKYDHVIQSHNAEYMSTTYHFNISTWKYQYKEYIL